MAQITIDIPNAQVPRVLTAFSATFDFATNGAGLTEAQFAKKIVAKWIKDITLNHERSAAAAALTDASIDVT